MKPNCDKSSNRSDQRIVYIPQNYKIVVKTLTLYLPNKLTVYPAERIIVEDVKFILKYVLIRDRNKLFLSSPFNINTTSANIQL